MVKLLFYSHLNGLVGGILQLGNKSLYDVALCGHGKNYIVQKYLYNKEKGPCGPLDSELTVEPINADASVTQFGISRVHFTWQVLRGE